MPCLRQCRLRRVEGIGGVSARYGQQTNGGKLNAPISSAHSQTAAKATSAGYFNLAASSLAANLLLPSFLPLMGRS